MNAPQSQFQIQVTRYDGPRPDSEGIDQWSTWCIDRISEALAEEGSAPPGIIFLAPDPEDEDGFIEGFLDLREFHVGDSDEEVHANLGKMYETVPHMLHAVHAFASFAVREAWTSEKEAETEGPVVSNEEFHAAHDDAVEVVTCLYETATSSKMRMFLIDRDGDKVSLGSEIEHEGDDLSGNVTFLHAPRPGEIPN